MSERVNRMPEDEQLLTMREAKTYLHLSRSTLIRYIEMGKIEGMKVGSTWRFYLSDIKRLVVNKSAKDVNEDG